MPVRSDAARKHLERRLAPMRNNPDLARPPRGWLCAIRDALGMTRTQLAHRLGITQPIVGRYERSELHENMTLKTLRKVGEAMDCTLVYALVPNKPFEELLRERARLHADEQLRRAHHTMRLENQALDKEDLEAERARLIE